MKKCISCDCFKSVKEFYKDKYSTDNLTSNCKECSKLKAKKRYKENRDDILNRQKEYYKDNKEDILKSLRESYEPAPPVEKECAKCGKKVTVPAYGSGHWKYCDKCAYRRTLRLRRIREYKRRKNNPTYRLNKNVGALVWTGLKKKKESSKWEKLPYTLDELRQHLESQFKPGMSWDNYGEWHLDHIKPRSAFHFSTMDDPGFSKCWDLDNLQPLWDYENIMKGNE